MASLPCTRCCSSSPSSSLTTSTGALSSCPGVSFLCNHETFSASSSFHLPAFDTRVTSRSGCFQRINLHALGGVYASGPNKAVLIPRQAASELNLEKPVIVIDNYDSFTYNLCQYLGDLGCSFEVYRNDELTVEELMEKEPCGVVISPGPGTPHDSGISLETVLRLAPTIPIFGVCMGLQCIGEAFGGKIVRSPFGVMHGKKSLIYYDEHGDNGLLAGLPNPFTAGRYHSLVIDKESFPHNELEITAWTEDGLIMGARHLKHRHVHGVQFHPESIITDNGMKIMENYLKLLLRQPVASTYAAL